MTDLAEQVVIAYKASGYRLAVAESCTGGLLGGAITTIIGSSDIFEGGFQTYSYEAKELLLSVPHAMLAEHGAVSEQVAIAMAQGVLKAMPAVDVALSVTGVAGPGDSENKPAGLVYIGALRREGSPVVEKHNFKGRREAVREQSVQSALQLALKIIT